MNRKLVFTVAAVAAVGTLAAPALGASKKKPITKTYSVLAPAPDPTNWASQAGVKTYSVCNQKVPQSYNRELFKAPEPGTLKVEVSGFTGDWDLLILNGKGTEAGTGGSDAISTPNAPTKEVATVKIKKKDTYTIVACNWAGGPTGTVKYTFTYAK
jgi:hypothetical protein